MSKVKTSSVESSEVIFDSTKKISDIFESEVISQTKTERNCSFPHILASPVHYEANYDYPLLVWLHDSGCSESELFEVVPKISARNYVSVAPRGLTRFQKRLARSFVNGRLVAEKKWLEPCNDWGDSDSQIVEAEKLVFASIDQAASKYNVNRRRVFLLGRGTGGTMALRVALRNPRRFAGVVSIDGVVPSLDGALLRNWKEARDLPILMTTGDLNSRNVPKLTVSQIKLFHTAGLTVSIRQYNEASNAPEALEARMRKILMDVNNWTMERGYSPRPVTPELFGRC